MTLPPGFDVLRAGNQCVVQSDKEVTTNLCRKRAPASHHPFTVDCVAAFRRARRPCPSLPLPLPRQRLSAVQNSTRASVRRHILRAQRAKRWSGRTTGARRDTVVPAERAPFRNRALSSASHVREMPKMLAKGCSIQIHFIASRSRLALDGLSNSEGRDSFSKLSRCNRTCRQERISSSFAAL